MLKYLETILLEAPTIDHKILTTMLHKLMEDKIINLKIN